MEVKLVEASYIQNEIQNEYQYIINLIDRVPVGLRDELQTMLDKRQAIIDNIEGQKDKMKVLMPTGTEKYIAEKTKEEDTVIVNVIKSIEKEE